MGFYFAHDIPEEIKADVQPGKQQALSSSKTLKQQQQQQLDSQRLSSVKTTGQLSSVQQLEQAAEGADQSKQRGSIHAGIASSTSKNAANIAAAGQEQGTGKSSQLGSTPKQQQQQSRKAGPIWQQNGKSLHGMAQPDAHAEDDSRPRDPHSGKLSQASLQLSGSVKPQGFAAGEGSGNGGDLLLKVVGEVGDLPHTKPPLGYYFSVPEGVKAAKDPLFQASEMPSKGAAAPTGLKGPLGYYFSKDISDSARRKGDWRARLLQSHLQPNAAPVNPF